MKVMMLLILCFVSSAKAQNSCKDYSGNYGNENYLLRVKQESCSIINVTVVVDGKEGWVDKLVLDGLPRVDTQFDPSMDLSIDRNTLSAYRIDNGFVSVRTLISATKPISWMGFKKSYSFTEDLQTLIETAGHYDMFGQTFGERQNLLPKL